MDKKEKIKRSFLIVVIMVIAVLSITSSRKRRERMNEEKIMDTSFTTSIIRKFNKFDGNKNYLISPYNIEIALNMLRDGAVGKTKDELDQVLGNRVINDLKEKDKIGIANAVFIKDIYKNDVKKSYYDTLNSKYKADVIYDEFIKPDKINNWVKEKTYGMIPKILNQMNKDYVLGLASALAIDVKWLNNFECTSTTEEEFTKLNNSKIKVEMMHKTLDTNSFKYIDEEDIKGIVLPYEEMDNKNIDLEFIALLPKEDLNTFINTLTKDKLDNILSKEKEASKKVHVNLSIPRFKYDYDAENFIDILKELGIKEAFDPDNANFKNMIEIPENVYVGEAIHKTHIELNELGTKAAAVTYFGMFKATGIMEKDYKEIDIKFNKPFIYLIRERNTNEMLFFGTVFEPNIWKGSTCNK